MKKLLNKVERALFPCSKQFDALLERHNEICESAQEVINKKIMNRDNANAGDTSITAH